MKTTALLALGALALVTGCKKSDPAAGAPGDPSATPAAGAALGPLGDFSGEIDVQATSTRDKLPTAPIVVLVSSGKVRFDIPRSEGRPSPHGYVLLDGRAKKATVVDDDKKTAMVFDASKLGSQLGQLGSPVTTPGTPSAPRSAPKITKTGHSDTVAGYECEDYDITSDDGKRERVCVSEGAASWLDVVAHAVPGNMLWAKEFLDGQKFPLRGITFDPDGTERDRVEVKKLEKKPLAASLFEVPAGYRVMDLEQMMGGLMAGALPGMAAGQPGAAGKTPPPGQAAAAGQTPPALPPGFSPGQMPNMPQMSAEQRAQMEEAMKKMREALEKKGASPAQ